MNLKLLSVLLILGQISRAQADNGRTSDPSFSNQESGSKQSPIYYSPPCQEVCMTSDYTEAQIVDCKKRCQDSGKAGRTAAIAIGSTLGGVLLFAGLVVLCKTYYQSLRDRLKQAIKSFGRTKSDVGNDSQRPTLPAENNGIDQMSNMQFGGVQNTQALQASAVMSMAPAKVQINSLSDVGKVVDTTRVSPQRFEQELMLIQAGQWRMSFQQKGSNCPVSNFRFTPRVEKLSPFLYRLEMRGTDKLGSWSSEGRIYSSDVGIKVYLIKTYNDTARARKGGKDKDLSYEGIFVNCNTLQGIWYYKGYQNNPDFCGTWSMVTATPEEHRP